MKTKFTLIAALVVAALPASALADRMDSQDATGDASAQAETREHTPFVWRVLRYPGRVAYSVVRAPLILSESAMGQRRFVSRDGFFAADEDERRSLTMRRVAFAGDTPDDD